LEQAARACGVSKQTLYSWRDRDEEFDKAVDAARGKARQEAVEGIKAAGRDDWRAYCAFLKSGWPNEYRERQAQTIIGTQNTLVVCDEAIGKMIQDMRQRLLGAKENDYLSHGNPIEAEVTEEPNNE
jgi:AcrR family transcriptional regulator